MMKTVKTGAGTAIARTVKAACLVSLIGLTPNLLAQVAGVDQGIHDAIHDQQHELTPGISPTLISIASRAIDTTQARPIGQLRNRVLAGTAPRRMIIQLDGSMTAARQAAIERAGLRILDYLPPNAYLIDTADVQPQRLGRLDFIRWHGEIESQHKLCPNIGNRVLTTPERLALDLEGRYAMHVNLFKGADLHAAAQQILDVAPSAVIDSTEEFNGRGSISLEIDADDVSALASIDGVQFIEELPEIALRNIRARWIVQSNVSGVESIYAKGIRGEGQIVGIMDGQVNPNHCSFFDNVSFGNNHRKIQAYNSSTGSSTHGNHVAGTVVGDDGTNTDRRGVAYMGKFVFNTISFGGAGSRLQQHHNQGARVHTNSWGDDGTTSYNSLTNAFDTFQYNNEDSLALLAVTNTSTLRNPENAKNLLAVGASRSAGQQHQHCSGGTGPTADGRRKPEIYAPGCGTISSSGSGSSCSTTSLTGTSMACPAVAGAAMLVRQYFVDGFYPSGAANPSDSLIPTGALMKAVLLNSTVDMTGISGYPSNLEGWGRVLLDEVLAFEGEPGGLIIEDIRNAEGLSTGQFFEIPFEVTSNADRLKVTLAWTDPPASSSTGTGPAWINDLDLLVTSPGGQQYRGNVFSGGQSVTGGSHDFRNNVEMVQRNVPETGVWTARVSAAAVNMGGTQGFALVISGRVIEEQPAPPPGPFTLNSPADGANNIDPSVDLDLLWSSSSDAESYIVTVTGGSGTVFGPATTSNTTIMIPAGTLDTSSTYIWSVVAENIDGVQTASTPTSRSFTTIDPAPVCDGDINGDGTSDLDDFAILVIFFGSGPGMERAQGDLNGDGFVDLDDFSILAIDFGCTE